MRKRVIAYIDGFNLYYGLRSAGWRRFMWLDVCRLMESLLKPEQTLAGVKYFTARLPGPGAGYERQKAFLESNEQLGRCSLHYGLYQTGKSRCTHCQQENVISKEKRTDVNIAVELLSDAYRGLFDSALLISGDSDLAPVLLKVKEEFPRRRIVIGFPPERRSLQLVEIADGHFTIGRGKLKDSQLPDRVMRRDGSFIERPQDWT